MTMRSWGSLGGRRCGGEEGEGCLLVGYFQHWGEEEWISGSFEGFFFYPLDLCDYTVCWLLKWPLKVAQRPLLLQAQIFYVSMLLSWVAIRVCLSRESCGG